jgi:rare lipoprotein A
LIGMPTRSMAMLLRSTAWAAMLLSSSETALAGEIGIASYYAAVPDRSQPLTAAHRHLPFGTYVRVTRLDTGKAIFVRINDRGPFIQGRIIDLSRDAAARLGMLDNGILRVNLEVVPSAALTGELHYTASTRCTSCVVPLLLD